MSGPHITSGPRPEAPIARGLFTRVSPVESCVVATDGPTFLSNPFYLRMTIPSDAWFFSIEAFEEPDDDRSRCLRAMGGSSSIRTIPIPPPGGRYLQRRVVPPRSRHPGDLGTSAVPDGERARPPSGGRDLCTNVALLDTGQALLRQIRDGARPQALPLPIRLRRLRQNQGFLLNFHMIHEDGQALPRPWMVGGDSPKGRLRPEAATLLATPFSTLPMIEDPFVCIGAAVLIPLRLACRNALPFERPIHLQPIPGPLPLPLLSEHRPAEAVRRLLAEGLSNSKHGRVPVDEPSAYRHLARWSLAQAFKETGIDIEISSDRGFPFLQKEGGRVLVWRMRGALPFVREIVQR